MAKVSIIFTLQQEHSPRISAIVRAGSGPVGGYSVSIRFARGDQPLGP